MMVLKKTQVPANVIRSVYLSRYDRAVRWITSASSLLNRLGRWALVVVDDDDNVVVDVDVDDDNDNDVDVDDDNDVDDVDVAMVLLV